MKVDRKVVEDYQYTLVLSGEEFSLIRGALWGRSTDDDYILPTRNACRALYAGMNDLPENE